MELTKENFIKVLKAQRSINHEMRNVFAEKGDKQISEEYLARACELSFVIGMLEDEKFFSTMSEIILKNA